MRILLVNPNRSIHVTERLARAAAEVLGDRDSLAPVTAAEGPALIASADQAAAAALFVPEFAASHAAGCDAVVLGVSLDCGLAATRALLAPLPVTAMTESALIEAAGLGNRTGIVTRGAHMATLYRDLAAGYGRGSALSGVAAPELPGIELAGAAQLDEAVLAALAKAALGLIEGGASSIVLSGAVLCGYGLALQARLPVPVLDAVQCAVRYALALANARAAPPLR